MPKTPTVIGQPEDMPELDPCEFGFVMDLAKGMSGSDAYRKNFPQHRHWKPNSIWCRASTLRASEKVQQWLEEITRCNLERGVLSLEEYIGKLDGLALRAEKSGNYGAAVNALHKAGQASGHHKEMDKPEDVRSEAQLLAELARLRSALKDEGVTVH